MKIYLLYPKLKYFLIYSLYLLLVIWNMFEMNLYVLYPILMFLYLIYFFLKIFWFKNDYEKYKKTTFLLIIEDISISSALLILVFTMKDHVMKGFINFVYLLSFFIFLIPSMIADHKAKRIVKE